MACLDSGKAKRDSPSGEEEERPPTKGPLKPKLIPPQNQKYYLLIEKTTFDVMLVAYEASSKVKIIKEIKNMFNLGLKEAKEKVDSVPSKILENHPREEAEKIQEQLKAIGCQIELA